MNNKFQPLDVTSDASNDALISSQLNALYASLNPQHVEEFYQGYSAWRMHQNIALLEAHLAQTDLQINDNAVLMQLVQPSTLSLVALTHLQSYGVDDINLLDTMLERGDEWLDHTMQLLTRCERLNLIHESYTEWCYHALEGAYDWLDSINETTPTTLATSTQTDDVPGTSDTDSADTTNTTDTTATETAELLLRKLMSDDETVKMPAPDIADIAPPLELEHTDMINHAATEKDDVQHVQIEEQNEQEEHVTLGSVEEVAVTNEQNAQSEQNIPDTDSHTQKLPGRSLVSRVLARIWDVQ